MMKNITLLLLCIVIATVSCKKSTFDPGTTYAKKVANGWWVTALENGTDVGVGYFFLSTYNTSGQPDSLWVDDNEQFWEFKVKAKIDMSALTLTTDNAQNEYYDSHVTIDNGKILLKAGHSTSGVITDSIYMEAHFDDDPDAATWTITGTARTGFIEDDH
ncbi:MAG TPA: lipid-binding protein [Puia sp.]